MLNYVSRISLIFWAIALAVGCTKSDNSFVAKTDEAIKFVPSEAYRANNCWTHKDGKFRAFMVLGKEENYAVPHFISVNCLVSGYASLYESNLRNVGSVLMLDSFGQLQSRFPQLKIGGNVASDQPFPSGKSEVYYFKANMKRIPHRYQVVYAPSKIELLIDTKISFNELLEMPPQEREKLLQSMM